MSDIERTPSQDLRRSAGTEHEHEQRVDQASGQRLGPPGNGDRDEPAIEAGIDRLLQAGAGH